MRYWFFTLALCFPVLATPATAQSWFTRDVCTVVDPAIDPAVMVPDLLAELDAESAKIENANGRLWRVTTPDGKVSHLWGTMHSTDRHIADLPDQLRGILSTARVVAIEVDPAMADRAAVQRYNSGEGIWSHVFNVLEIDPKVRRWVRARAKTLGISGESLSYMTPAGMASLVMGDPCDDFFSATYAIQDTRVAMIARDHGARIIGFETDDDFVRYVNDPDNKHIAEAILNAYGTYLGPGDTRAERRTAFEFYLRGQIGHLIAWERHALHEFFGAEQGQAYLDAVDGYLVDERNLNFMAKAEQIINEGQAVIAVGCFHLPGPGGLVSLLRQRGYKVERVVLPGEVP